MLNVTDLSCSRGDRTLFRALSFALSPGQLLAVTGSNGSGKTTLLRALCGFSPCEAGSIAWDGQEIGKNAEHYVSRILYIGHRNALKDDLTPGENLTALATIAGAVLDGQAIRSALQSIGLEPSLDRLPTRVLSEGQRRRVALARLWCEVRPLWILDEPFTALDAQSAQLFRRRLQRHLEDGGMVVTATHEPVGLSGESMREIRLA